MPLWCNNSSARALLLKMPSVRKNIAYSIVLSSVQYIVPLIVFPYVSRVLGPDRLGLVNFIDGTIEYFIILSMLGMGTLGIREIARHKGDQAALSATFSSLLSLNFISTLIACAVLAGAYLMVDSLRQNPELIAIGVFKLLFTFLLIEWLYKGLEEFRFITIRTLLVRLTFIIAIFLFVRGSGDYLAYYIILVAAVVGNALINLIYSRRYVRFSFSRLRIREFVKPFLVLGCYAVLTAMYTTFNVMYLGFVSDDAQVAYYTTSAKIYAIIIAMFTAFTGAMMPRLSALLADGNDSEFRRYIAKSVGLLMAFSVPIVVFGAVMAPEIVNLVSGPAYDGAITPLRIVMPLIFIIGYEQILVYQILIPSQRDHTVFINSIIGAALGLTLNILIVPHLAATGSALVWLGCECAILLLSQVAVFKVKAISFPIAGFLKNIAAYLPMAAILLAVQAAVGNRYWSLCAGIGIFLVYTILAQLTLLRNEEFIGITTKIARRLHR